MKELENRIAIALCAAAFVGSVFAIDDLPAPNEAGKIVMAEAGGKYAATTDVVCTQVVFSANNISVDLSADGGKTISIPSTVTSDGFAFSERYFTASVLDGIWDFGGSANLKVGSSHHDHAVTFSGTKVRNVNSVIIGDTWKRCKLTLEDGAELGVGVMRIANGSNAGQCTFEILGGSTASVVGNFIIEDGTSVGAGGNLLSIAGTGSSLSAPNASVVLGRGCSNDRMSVTDNGSAALQSLTAGGVLNGTVAKNTVLTVDDATLTTTGNLTIGSGGSFGNRAEFTNATLSAKSIVVGSGANSTNNTLVLAGSTTLTQTTPGSDPFFFGAAGENEVILTDGFQYEFTNKGDDLMKASSSNVVRICNGAKVTKSTICYLGTRDASSHDNTYSVEAGGTSVLYRVNFGGARNRIVVNDGVFELTRASTGALALGCDTTDTAANPTVGCELVLRGTKPQYKTTGETVVYGAGRGALRFDLPAAALETVPMDCGTLKVQEGAAIHVKCDDYLSYIGDERGNVVLASASTAANLTLPQSVLDATNAELPDRCRLVVEGKDIVLKIRGNKGFVLSFR